MTIFDKIIKEMHNILYITILCFLTSFVAWWSELLTTYHEVPGSLFCHGNFSLQGKIPIVTMVWVASRL
jgi:hypothetical protein